MAKAKLIIHHKENYDDGFIVEFLVWQLPQATIERPHGFKYSFFYGNKGVRVIGYDNERGKGDHRHYLEVEEPVIFDSLEKLISDFMNDVAKHRRP